MAHAPTPATRKKEKGVTAKAVVAMARESIGSSDVQADLEVLSESPAKVGLKFAIKTEHCVYTINADGSNPGSDYPGWLGCSVRDADSTEPYDHLYSSDLTVEGWDGTWSAIMDHVKMIADADEFNEGWDSAEEGHSIRLTKGMKGGL